MFKKKEMAGKFNKFSGKYEPDKTEYIEPSDENVAKFREVQLKLDRISNGNEEELAFKLATIAQRFNVHCEKIELDLDYADAMSVLEEVFNEAEADRIILALEELAKEYGYLPEMDNESSETEEEMCWYTKESFEGLMTRIQREYIKATEKDLLKNSIAAGMRTYEINKDNDRPKVKRGEIWKAEITTGVGRETTGNRWVIVISNSMHAQYSDAVNVISLDGQPAKNPKSHMQIKNTDLKNGRLEKYGRVNITDIFTIDKKRMIERKGEVSDKFMNELMKRIAFQLGI